MLERHLAADRAAFLRAATIAAAVYNANAFRSADAPPVSPLDFLSPAERRKLEPEQTQEEMEAVLTSIFGVGPGKP